MPISSNQQTQIQNQISSADATTRETLQDEAELSLGDISMVAGMRSLSVEEKRQAEWAIEILVRLEATAKGKGRFFRMKRRAQLVMQYIGGR